MKKVIVLGLLIMAFSATVYAQPKIDFKGSGSIEVVSIWMQNVAPGDGAITTFFAGAGTFVPPGGYWDPRFGQAASGALNRRQAWMEERGILRFDAAMGKEVSATFIFELDSARWGERGGTRGALGNFNADTAGIEVKNMYLDVALPYFGIPAPMTIRAGIQPFGVRPHMFAYTDGAGVTGGIKIDPALISLYWAKAIEGKDATADDVDIYGINANVKIGPVTPGAYFFYYNMNTYPFPAAPVLTYGTSLANNTAAMWWLGFYLDGKLGPVNINFDALMDYGSVTRRDNVALPVGVEDKVKYRGGAAQLKIDFPWEKFNFGALGMYATGADRNKTSRFGLPGDVTANGTFTRRVSGFVIPPGSEEWAVWGESMILGNNFITATALPQGMWPSLTFYPGQMTRGAIGGTWVAKLYASMKATPWYKVTLQGLYIGDTTRHGNTLGDAVKSTGGLRDDKTIGWELDLINEIQIYSNLKWSVGGGILFAGNALDQQGVGRNISPHVPWIIATKLRYDF